MTHMPKSHFMIEIFIFWLDPVIYLRQRHEGFAGSGLAGDEAV